MPGFVKVQLLWLGVSLAIPTVCMVLVLAHAADPLLLSNIALPGLLGCWVVALLTPLLWGRGADRALRLTGFVLSWSFIAVAFPLAWDLTWAMLHRWVNGAAAEDTAKWFYWAYAVADTRFLRSDPLMIIVEYWSGVIAVIEIVFVRLFLRNRLRTAVNVFALAACLQFYGCTVFFFSELMNGLADIDPTPVSYLKFFGLNGMWMVVPSLAGAALVQLLRTPGYDGRDAVDQLFGRTRTLVGV